MRLVYLDNNATTRTREEVLDAMLPYYKDIYGNASSVHQLGRTARKAIDAERHILNTLINDIKELERQLMETRKACDDAYALVVSERKAAYEQRQKGRQDRQERPERKFDDAPRRRAKPERKGEYDSDADMDKYMKDYDDTVSMEEIVVFEKKEKKAPRDNQVPEDEKKEE